MSRPDPAPSTAVAPFVADSTTLIQMIERASRDPQVSVEKMERLYALYKDAEAIRARVAYTKAMVQVKAKLPIIDRRGRIEIRKKSATGERDGAIQQSTPYALWEDIDAAITPILAEYGFALTFRSGVAAGDTRITVTAILDHNEGHREETTITLPHDPSGSKNAVQAVGSSTSYGKRYTAGLLINIRTKGEDDDGEKGGAKVIDDAQIAEFQKQIDAFKDPTVIARFLDHMGAQSLSDIPDAHYQDGITALDNLRRFVAEKAAKPGEKK